jgi:hypothetical protein
MSGSFTTLAVSGTSALAGAVTVGTTSTATSLLAHGSLTVTGAATLEGAVTAATLFAGNASSTATPFEFTNNSGGTFPSGGFAGSLTYNFSSGQAEVDFWNNYATAAHSFQFYQQTGTASADLLAVMTPSIVALTGSYAPTGVMAVATVNAGFGGSAPAIMVGNNSSGVYPSEALGGAITVNFSNGDAEIDFWNSDTAASESFVFYQRTGTASASLLASLSTSGLNVLGVVSPSLNVTGNPSLSETPIGTSAGYATVNISGTTDNSSSTEWLAALGMHSNNPGLKVTVYCGNSVDSTSGDAWCINSELVINTVSGTSDPNWTTLQGYELDVQNNSGRDIGNIGSSSAGIP